MEQHEWIPADLVCTHYHVDISLVRAIGEQGLVDINDNGDRILVSTDHLEEVERILRLHTDLGINLEGIEAIRYLLERLDNLREEVRLLKSRLRVYE
jgi:chaperone modulatory protein CbpM